MQPLPRAVRQSILWFFNPLLVLPLVFIFHQGHQGPRDLPTESDTSAKTQSQISEQDPSGQRTLLRLKSDMDPEQDVSVVAELGHGRRIRRIHLIGVGGTDQSWTIEELTTGARALSPVGAFSDPSGNFATLQAIALDPRKGGELDLSFPGTVERGYTVNTRLKLEYDGTQWSARPLENETLQAKADPDPGR